MLIENISLPPEVEAAIDKRSSMGAVGDLNNYMKFQAANSLENPGGTSEAFSAGIGFSMAGQMAQQMGQQNQAQPAAAPPPIPAAAQYHVAVNGQQMGPFGMDQLQSQVTSGELTGQSLVWKNGMAAWTPASQVPELQPLFANVPPPLPPQ
jgi:membrane protease subunit (stomatin/prohibitin family)